MTPASETGKPGPVPSPVEGAPKGYVSEESKSGYMARMWVAAISCLVAQLVLPTIVSFMAMHSMMEQATTLEFVDASRTAYWRGSVWLLHSRASMDDGIPRPVKISRWDPGTDAPPSEAKIPPMYEPSLVSTGGSLWVVGASMVVEISDDGTHPVRVTEHLGPVSRPFAFRGRPALIEEGPDRYVLKIFDGAGWVEDTGVEMGTIDPDIAIELLAVLDGPEETGAALAWDDAVYYQPDLSRLGHVPVSDWERVDDLKLYWAAAVVGAAPVVFTSRDLGFDSGIDGFARGPSGWEKTIEIEHGLVGDMGICPLDAPDRYLLLSEGMPGSVSAWEIRGNEVVSRTKIGGGDMSQARANALSWIANGLGFITTIAMVFILSSIMGRARVRTHRAGERTATYASVSRRGAASLVDLSLVAAPLAALWFLWVGDSPLDVEQHGMDGAMRFMGFLGIAFAWTLLWVFAFSFMEARWGQTPGKRLFRIEVVSTDLGRVGLGRAVLRNILKVFADSFFDFLVGIVFIAVTPKWQRIGDLAGKTIVIEAG